jgi:hypothetical protein
MTDQAIEQEIQDKGLTAPRITPADVEANIQHEFYVNVGEAARIFGQQFARVLPLPDSAASLNLLTICVLVLKNGFTVTGESACASPENFDVEIGRKIARQNAVQKIWLLMGYELRTKLSRENQLQPSYYVRHPDDSYSLAEPQPVFI